MPSFKSFLSDQETRIDLLNNEAIALTIVGLLRESPDKPVTIGVHGDWGAGKSSILEMIEAAFEKDDNVLCLKFNGWRFQGFEDAKIALLEGIVNGLVEKRSLTTKVGDQVVDIFKRIDWLKVVKRTGGLALTAFTGIPDMGLVHDVVQRMGAALTKPDGTLDGEKAKSVLKELEGMVKPGDKSKNVPAEVEEFRKSFDKLLEKAGVKQLVVLVDDLDRCLPDTAIETLEAIRLFVFTSKTAFVVAADEAMIEYSVRRHFPGLPESHGPSSYSRNYLEKLIQVPFRIPALGESETRIYVSLVLAASMLGESSAEFNKLLEHARECLRRPWLGTGLDQTQVAKSLGSRLEEGKEAFALSDRIGHVLARGTKGNPRQVKRFLNAMILRTRTAEARGFGDEIALAVLAKLMLAERFSPKFFEAMAQEAGSSPQGRSETVAILENVAAKPAAKKTVGGERPKGAAEWESDGWAAEWSKLDPKISEVDLRPYLFVAKDGRDYMSAIVGMGHLAPMADALMGNQLAVVGIEEVKWLPQTDAKALFDEVSRRVLTCELTTLPPGIDGLRALAKHHPALRSDLIGFLKALPKAGLGVWVVGGWTEALPEKPSPMLELLRAWASCEENPFLSQAATEALKVMEGK